MPGPAEMTCLRQRSDHHAATLTTDRTLALTDHPAPAAALHLLLARKLHSVSEPLKALALFWSWIVNLAEHTDQVPAAALVVPVALVWAAVVTQGGGAAVASVGQKLAWAWALHSLGLLPRTAA